MLGMQRLLTGAISKWTQTLSISILRSQHRRAAISFQSRITGAAMLTAAVVLLAASLVFIVEQCHAERRSLIARQTALAHVVASGSTVRRAFEAGSPAVLTSLLQERLGPSQFAYVLDPEGGVLVGFGPPSPAAAEAAGQIGVRAPIVVDGRRVGDFVLYTAPRPLPDLLPRFVALAAALFVAATGLSLFLGRWLAGRVTEPVDRLSRAMREVADSGDFTRKVERTGDDELARLGDAFNDLLSRLDVKDRHLRQTMGELVAARDAAEAANRLKSQFLANMSHEIRTPLNGLLAMTQVMALEDLGEVQHERLDVIRSSGQALLSILNDVLDVSKIEAGKLELEVGEFDTEAVLHSAYAAFAAVADKKGLTLSLDVDKDAQGLRAGDAQRLGQILNNLISNALKFTQTGGVRIAAHGEGPGGAEGLRLSVSDTGIGIAEAARPLLFKKFSQADSSTTRRFGGTGLGLAICQELSELMGGRIWLDSIEGEGSTFHVFLPLGRVCAVQSAAPQAAPAPQPARVGSVRVLAAEDNATNQLVLKTILDIFGVELTLVDNGRKAVEAWAAGDFDVILMDIQMPEMDGLTATRLIRAGEAETGRVRTPIVALSAHAMTHQVTEYLDAGVDLHVPKPIELPKLQTALEAATAARDAAKAAAAARSEVVAQADADDSAAA
jgi:signal transduction histidine kinase/FixJ family two-component response regulator